MGEGSGIVPRALPHWSSLTVLMDSFALHHLLILTCHDSVEGNSPKNFS